MTRQCFFSEIKCRIIWNIGWTNCVSHLSLFQLAIWDLIFLTDFDIIIDKVIIKYHPSFNISPAGASSSCGWQPKQVHHQIFIFLNTCSNIALAPPVRVLYLPLCVFAGNMERSSSVVAALSLWLQSVTSACINSVVNHNKVEVSLLGEPSPGYVAFGAYISTNFSTS